jgi:protein-L-isoaspartate(D-aspartate) O-methyltransferase
MLVDESRDVLAERMIEQQVRAWDVLDERVLETLRRVPRDAFVPSEHRYLAFADVEVPLPQGQSMLRPNVVGRLLQALELTGNERVLEIGGGSGYVSACLAASAASVLSLEIYPDLAELARANLAGMGFGNAEVSVADAMQTEPAGRFDAIAVTGSLPLYDQRFERMLSVGGRLFVVVGEPPVMDARLVRRSADGSWSHESLFETVIDPLMNARRRQGFEF